MIRYKATKFLCNLLPPAIAQRVRNNLFSIELARVDNSLFKKKSITGSWFNGELGDYHSYRFAFHGYFDWRNVVITAVLSKDKLGDIIEIGANVGTETICYSDLAGTYGTVHAFEPLPKNIKMLKALQPNIDNIKIYQNAVSNISDLLKFEIPPEEASGTGKIITGAIEDTPAETMAVEAFPLDRFIDEFKSLCLISIDTEGHEPFVLEGSSESIRKHKPAIILEVNPKLLKKYAKSTPVEIYDFLKQLDYSCYCIEFSSVSKVNEEILKTSKPYNWLCLPNSKLNLIKTINRNLGLRAYVPWYLLAPLRST